MPTIPLLSQFYIKFAGVQPEDLMPDLRRIEIDSNLYLPDMCLIEINDPRFRWAEDQRLRLGQEVQIESRTSENERGSPARLFSGQITSVEADMRENGVATLVLRCYDRSHLMHRGTKVRAFVQATDSDIAATIAREHGLQASVDPTSQVHTQIFQDNVSDYEFLMDRARAVGHLLTVDDRTLCFKKPASIVRPVVEIDFGTSLLEFHPRLTVASQVKEVSVRGWDPKNKRALVGQAAAAEFQAVKAGAGRRASSVVQQAFGVDAGELLVTDQPVASQAEGDALAKALLSDVWARDVRADGTAHGNPAIQPGCKLKVGGIGTVFAGEYFVTSTRHVFDSEGHFLTHFNVSGFSAETTADLILQGAAPGQTATGRIAQGIAIGVVTNNKDPENLGRVKVKFPWLADQAESDWARLAAPMAGSGRGFFFLPEINDEVVVAFEQGDFNRPFIVGVLWNGQDAPPLQASAAVGGDGKVNKRIIKSRSGHTITLDDSSGAEKIEIVDKTGGNKIVIDSVPGKLTVEMSGDVTVTGTNISLEGKAKVELKAPQIDITASGKVKVSGPLVELN
jgi:Rhs element Vgr protein